MSHAPNRDRGQGNMANALKTRRRRPEQQEAPGKTAPNAGAGPRKKTGKRSNPNYTLASAFVKKDVYERVRQALLSGKVKQQTLLELRRRQVLHQTEKPLYSDLVEMLLREWLERVDWKLEE